MHVATCKAHYGTKALMKMQAILFALLEAKAVSIDEQLDSSFRRQIQENRNKLGPIISTILFCCMHVLALRGTESNSGNLYELLEFRVESGDEVLGNRLSIGSCSAEYGSPTKRPRTKRPRQLGSDITAPTKRPWTNRWTNSKIYNQIYSYFYSPIQCQV